MTLLTEAQISELKLAHKQTRDKRLADRIKSVLYVHYGLSYTEIAKLLLFDESTTGRYYKKYQAKGLSGLLEYHYTGGTSRLSIIQKQAIKEYFTDNTPQTAKEATDYVQKTYGISYTVLGITKQLHQLGFAYKKPKVIPGKLNQEKQEEFVKQYEKVKTELGEKDHIYFLDATHPQHNTKPSHGWILKGKKNDKHVKTNTGRERLNLNGALNFKKKTAIVLEEKTVNQDAVVRLLEAIKKKQKHGKAYLILDNAKYNHSRLVRNWILNHPRFQLMYLPAYSPNLNLIERLWRFFHQKVTNNRYFETFNEFKSETLNFFEHLKNYETELASLLTDNFHLFNNPSLQT